MNITPISESAVVCSLPPPASLQQQRQLWAFANQLQSEQDIVEVVVGMNNLTVFTDFYVDFAPLIQRLEQYWAELQVSTFQGRHIEIPVIYGGELGYLRSPNYITRLPKRSFKCTVNLFIPCI